MFLSIGSPISASGTGRNYQFVDDLPPVGDVWYRIVELTIDGPGDTSAPVRVRDGVLPNGARDRVSPRRERAPAQQRGIVP